MKIKLDRKYLQYSIFVSLILVISYVLFATVFSFTTKKAQSSLPPVLAASDCLPAFRDGGGPYYQANAPFRENIAPDSTTGEKLYMEGYIYNSTCTNTIAHATLDIWQASEEGTYEDEYYRGQVTTDENGYYKFESVIPLGYGEGTAYRPPHIHFKVHIDGEEVVTSQMFFEDVRGRQGFNDEYIIDLEQNANAWNGTHNIIIPDIKFN
ncbi:hypothetical protein KC717_01075 [Candidatus Dojkabacteria bacterium]|uniref:Intradiol ring-cleavage dioxygenases domain-containing protein n=1 Tax=Candidatus Dojkabacteria bacterium TaxID=2099670 RepID=A0A955L7T6_9BACT|nr:hypothetical protein [Candidatus Dojkabacteria bacterium]